MTDGKKPPLSLDDEDLLGEIDQWGDMFDALHEDEPATGVRDPVPTPVPAAAPIAIAAAAAPPVAASRDEVDFSDLGVDGPPEALGSLLGTPPPLQPVEDAAPSEPARRPSARRIPTAVSAEDDEVLTSASRPSMSSLPQAPTDEELFGELAEAPAPAPAAPVVAAPRAPRVGVAATVRRDALDARKRASEATRVADPDRIAEIAGLGEPHGDDESPFGGAESTRVASANEIEQHSGRAARRTDAPPVRGEPRPPGRRADSDFGSDDDSGIFSSPEATKIADVGQLEKLAEDDRAARAAEAAVAASAAALLAESAPSIELTVDDEFYADFEIGDREQESPDLEEGGTPGGGKRTTAHVVRRQVAPPSADAPVLEIEAEASDELQLPVAGEIAEAVPARVTAEDDFSDVAHAIQADEIAPAPAPAPAAALDAVPSPITPEEDFSDLVEPSDVPAPVPGAAEDIASAAFRAAEAAVRPAPTPAPSAPSTPVIPPADEDEDDSDQVELAAFHAAQKTTPPAPSTRPPTHPPPAAGAPRSRPRTDAPYPEAELPAAVFGNVEPELDLDAIALPELVDPTTGFDPAEEAARMILVYERELETADDPALAAALRCEAARLYERLGDGDRARFHYEAAMLHDPRSFIALRGLRRIARAAGDTGEVTRQLEAELAIAGADERRALAQHRVDLLMASGEQDLARVAVGELLDEGQGDVRALLAQLELTFLDGRVDELGDSLERLAAALGGGDLRATLGVALGHLRERPDGDPVRARAAFAQGGPGGAAQLGLRRTGEAAQAVAATAAIAELVASGGDPTAAAGLFLRTAGLAAGADDTALAIHALDRARTLAPRDPLIAEAVWGAVGADASPDGLAAQIDALTVLGEVAATPAERTWALAHVATLRQARGAEGDDEAAGAALATAAVADPGHDHVTAAHEAQLAGAGDWAAVASLALARVGADPDAERDRVTAARALAAAGTAESVDQAVTLLAEGRARAPGSATLADVHADALAVAGRWSERVTLWSQLAAPGERTADTSEQIDPELAALRAAAAAEEAVAAMGDAADADTTRRALTSSLEAWTRVLDFDAESPRAHAAAIAAARRLCLAAGADSAGGDVDILDDALGRAQQAQRGAGAITLGLERARLHLRGTDPDLAEADALLAQLPDDPRKLAAAAVVAARAGRWSEAALLYEERAAAAAETGATLEAVTLRYRAAQILLDKGDDLARAAQLLGQVLEDRPQLTAAADALAAVRRRLGDSGAVASPTTIRATAAELGTGADAFARLVREAEVLGAHGDAAAGLALLTRALEVRASDPLATEPLARLARAAGEPGPLTHLALEELRAAESAGDDRARADAYETMAKVDAELRGDVGSAVVSWEAAAAADPSRHWVLRQLARAYAQTGRTADLYAVRGKQLAALSSGAADGARGGGAGDDAADAVALGLDRAALGEKEGVSDDELRAAYQDVVDRDPHQRIAVFHLESLVRRGGSTPELARLEEIIADLYPDDHRARASFLTRAGETLADLGQLEPAIERFRAADALSPGFVPALQGWRFAALKGGLWLDVAEAASREAAATSQDEHRAALYHLAGVTLMDRALVGERAVPLLRKALAADPRTPSSADAFVRLRILLDEQGEQEELARLLEERLVHEDATPVKISLHRALADLYRNFLGDRESAKYNLRAILELEPNDLRAVATLSDICWEQGAWAEAAEALVTRARLERDPTLLRQLYYRLGTIYADRIPEPQLALKAFQRVLAADPDDVDALERIADLGIATGEWRMALGACERLVKGEADSERKVAHLHRVGRIFLEGFHDKVKAERAYRMALDATPTSDAALARLVEFYQQQGDLRSVRMHLDRLANLMRSRLDKQPDDGVAARVISRAMAARHGAGVMGSLEVARAAAELASTLGAAEDRELALINMAMPAADLRTLIRPEADDVLYPRSVPSELRQIFAMLGERVAKHVGADLRPYGVTRGDRLRARENPVATLAQEVADQLGLGEIDVYVSTRAPLVMQAEPTSPVSLVIGSDLARADSPAVVRYAAGAALKLAQSHLAIVARMGETDLAALTVALLRLFVPDLPYLRVDEAQVAAQLQKLKRLIPSGLLAELRPYALALDVHKFDHELFQRGVVAGGLRAGVRAAGSLGVALQVIAAQRAITDLGVLARDPLVRDVVAFAVGDAHAQLIQLTSA